MPKLRMNGKEYEVPDSADWTAGELAEAEHAIGAMFGNGSKGDDIAITTYVAMRRVDKETHQAQLGDAAKGVKFSDLITEEEAPLEEAVSLEEPQTSGPPPSGASE